MDVNLITVSMFSLSQTQAISYDEYKFLKEHINTPNIKY